MYELRFNPQPESRKPVGAKRVFVCYDIDIGVLLSRTRNRCGTQARRQLFYTPLAGGLGMGNGRFVLQALLTPVLPGDWVSKGKRLAGSSSRNAAARPAPASGVLGVVLRLPACPPFVLLRLFARTRVEGPARPGAYPGPFEQRSPFDQPTGLRSEVSNNVKPFRQGGGG